MAEFFGAGDSIAGEKILFCFGNWKGPHRKEGKSVGTLDTRGWAAVTKPLKRSTTGTSRELDELSCEKAAFSCGEFRIDDKRKVTVKNHTGFQGVLEGDATCTITIPHRNIPQRPQAQ